MNVSQPRGLDHPLYKLIDEQFEVGDVKMIAAKLGVTYGIVSRVKCGKQRSVRIWKEIIKTALWRKKNQDEIMEILSMGK